MARQSKISADGLSAIRKEINAISSRGYNTYKVFNDWISLMFFAYMHDDPPYLKIMGEYRNEAPEGQREADHFAMAHAYLLEHMKNTHEEVLSGLYMEFAPNEHIGQFFTPPNLASLMCGLTMKDLPKDRNFTIYDPACGASVFFIAAAKNMTFEENGRAIFVGQDLDMNCCRMCALNLMFFNLNGVIIHGNTLTMDIKNAWETRRSLIYGGSLHNCDLEEVKKWYCGVLLENANEYARSEAMQNKLVAGKQCSLFG